VDNRGRRFSFPAIALMTAISSQAIATQAQAQSESQTQSAATANPGVFEEFVLGVEDKLTISVWKEPDLTKTVSVRPDGKITFPLVGDVQAAGRAPRQLTEDLTKLLGRFIKEPVVTVVVEEINNFKVFVLGEVSLQGALNLRRRTRLLEAIALAGGVSKFADKSNVLLLRFEDGKETRTRIDYRKVVSGEKSELNVFLKPGDTIIVN
jgi:polysaccharide export outer membrane protein